MPKFERRMRQYDCAQKEISIIHNIKNDKHREPEDSAEKQGDSALPTKRKCNTVLLLSVKFFLSYQGQRAIADT